MVSNSLMHESANVFVKKQPYLVNEMFFQRTIYRLHQNVVFHIFSPIQLSSATVNWISQTFSQIKQENMGNLIKVMLHNQLDQNEDVKYC